MTAILMTAQWGRGDERMGERGGRIRRLRTSDQSTPGHERDGAREGGRGETGRVWRGG